MQGAAHAFQVVESGHTLSAVGKATALMVGIKRGGARSDGSLAGAAVETAVYGYVLLQGAGLLADGSELLLEVVEPGIIGGAAPRPPSPCPGLSCAWKSETAGGGGAGHHRRPLLCCGSGTAAYTHLHYDGGSVNILRGGTRHVPAASRSKQPTRWHGVSCIRVAS